MKTHIEMASELLTHVAFKDVTTRDQVAADLVALIEDISGGGKKDAKTDKLEKKEMKSNAR